MGVRVVVSKFFLGKSIGIDETNTFVRTFFMGWDKTQSGQGPLQLNL